MGDGQRPEVGGVGKPKARLFVIETTAFDSKSIANLLERSYKRTMEPTPGLIFSGIFLPLLAVCYYCGVIPVFRSGEGIIRKADDPHRFNVVAASFLVALVALPFIWR